MLLCRLQHLLAACFFAYHVVLVLWHTLLTANISSAGRRCPRPWQELELPVKFTVNVGMVLSALCQGLCREAAFLFLAGAVSCVPGVCKLAGSACQAHYLQVLLLALASVVLGIDTALWQWCVLV